MLASRWLTTLLVIALFFVAGCGGNGGNATTPPSGWAGDATRMWKDAVDTSAVFRDLNGLAAMGVLENEVALSGGQITTSQFQDAIKRTLEELYRSNPAVVDSLFEQHAMPELQEAELGQDAVQNGRLDASLRQTYKQRALQAIGEHYEQPTMQEGITDLPYPDSLRTDEHSGTVEVQVHVSKNGQINAVEVVDGTHPALDAIVMRAATQTTWQPAFVTVDGEQVAYSGWGRLSTTFPAPR